MFKLLLKEINQFFSSLTGYIVLFLFVLMNGLFIWVFPGNYNVLDSGYASLNSVFQLAPWVFLFLVPAVSMRMFADEKKSGTLELLLTRPVTDLEIVMAKYLSSLVLVILSLLPTLIYYASVYAMGNPVGNIDSGGFWGSYIGLLFLASSYAAVGVFASSLTDNQVVAFLLALILSFVCYLGFDYIGSVFSASEVLIVKFGINEHYRSMSRGVIDTRDVLYFLSLITLFIAGTRLSLQSRKW